MRICVAVVAAVMIAGLAVLLSGCSVYHHVEYTSASPTGDGETVYLVGRTTTVSNGVLMFVDPWVLQCAKGEAEGRPVLDCKAVEIKGVPKPYEKKPEDGGSKLFEITGDIDM